MLIFCILGFKNLIQPSFIIFQSVFLRYSCCFSLHLHMHVHPPSFKVQCRLGRDRGSRQTGVNILPKYFVRIWINFWRCEQSMIARFLSVCWPIILEANFYMSGCVRVWSGCGLLQTTTVSTCRMEASTQHRLKPSHLKLTKLASIDTRRVSTWVFCFLQYKNSKFFWSPTAKGVGKIGGTLVLSETCL